MWAQEQARVALIDITVCERRVLWLGSNMLIKWIMTLRVKNVHIWDPGGTETYGLTAKRRQCA